MRVHNASSMVEPRGRSRGFCDKSTMPRLRVRAPSSSYPVRLSYSQTERSVRTLRSTANRSPVETGDVASNKVHRTIKQGADGAMSARAKTVYRRARATGQHKRRGSSIRES